MTDNIAAMTIATLINIGKVSDVAGSVLTQHVIFEPDSLSTGSFSVNAEWWSNQIRSGQNIHIINNQKKPIEQKLDIIKSTFAMTEEEIALRLGVGRKTLFNWKKQESVPNKDKVQSLFELYVLAKNWIDAGFTTDIFDLETPVLAGKSIKDMLNEPKLDSEKILFAGNRLVHQALDEVELF
ncbi:hypothetical protein GWP85_07085 [Acinetobacter beijerinckii]|uniref:hypothetical protein n=1 Tax=Acinetobacter beijerinckii TaxID=262668 RepID=UPI0023DDFE27|nr:hypothetical protein [Acinetobacter beijerinckii]MDF2417282.1 hypothetical protein [Acinetobacter beijerinckii]